MKTQSPALSLLVFFFVSLLFSTSCKKINEATELGGNLIPAVDNITTFETFLNTTTDNVLYNDTTRVRYIVYPGGGVALFSMALGNISNDPVFGSTNAGMYFNVGLATYGANPFGSRDSIVGMDSVVLSMAFDKAYGDTNSLQTVRVYDISQASGFNDSTMYPYSQPDFATGAELGSKTFTLSSLKDSLVLIRKKDTLRTANVLRIRLDNGLGNRFASYNTGTYSSDLAFKIGFPGLAVKADSTSGNGLGFFDLYNTAKTNLVFYCRVMRNGAIDTTTVSFTHMPRISGNTYITGGQANPIRRKPAGEWASALNNGTGQDERVYLQSQPGSFGTIKIPALDTMSAYTVHLAELIAYRTPSVQEEFFTPPNRLFLDRINAKGDSAFTLEKDFRLGTDGSVNFNFFGGSLRSDNSYRFNITHLVQDILTKKYPKPEDNILRLYAPYHTSLFDRLQVSKSEFFVTDNPAKGRVVLAGGNFADPAMRMRVRLVYSKI